jgi:hypothetical protein
MGHNCFLFLFFAFTSFFRECFNVYRVLACVGTDEEESFWHGLIYIYMANALTNFSFPFRCV